MIVNGCQSKVDPKLIFGFLDGADNKFRDYREYEWKDDSNGYQNIVWTIDEQRTYLQYLYPGYFAPEQQPAVNPVIYQYPNQYNYQVPSNYPRWNTWTS